MDSNLTLRSNIYINRTGRGDDVEFLRHITDYRVLKKQQQDAFYYSYGGEVAWMTPLQKEILNQGQPGCAYERGTMSWGVPIGANRMVCRCEQYDCPRFSTCAQYPNFERIRREAPATAEPEASAAPPAPAQAPAGAEAAPAEMNVPAGEPDRPIAPVGDAAPRKLDISIEELRRIPVAPSGRAPDVERPSPEAKPASRQLAPASSPVEEPARLVSQSEIIEADPRSRVWVNGAPGTGKTYVVIQRLKRLLEAGVDGSILVLCFSRNAVQVIRERLTQELGAKAEGWLADEKLIVRTFDSFASYLLADELNPAWDYDRRIEACIRALGRNPGVLNDSLGYLIVDEIQDTVGVRARLLLALLDDLNCGALLLGDRCQAIFDWTARGAGGMDFDSLAAELAWRRIPCRELEGNRRQCSQLADASARLRDCMISGSEEAQQAEIESFRQWARERWGDCAIKALADRLDGPDSLVLCKTNGDAAYISQRLFESNPPPEHVQKQSARHVTLAPWIAKALDGNDGHSLSREAFAKNTQDWEVDGADEKWAALKSLDGHPCAPTLHIPELLDALRRADSLPACCVNRFENCAVVSTIHRAKGSEAKRVYWLDEPLVYASHLEQDSALSDSLRTAYVAATRAREAVHPLKKDKKCFVRLIEGNRWIQTGMSRNGNIFCKGLALLPEDVDMASFASGASAADRQAVLGCLEPGAAVTIYPDRERRQFEIYSEDGWLIGLTAPAFRSALEAGIRATNRSKNFPLSIPGAFISAVVTVVGPGNPDVDARYATSGCWLGVELGGLPRLEWDSNH